MNIAVLFRKGIDQEHEAEFEVASKYFDVYELRSQCPKNSTIIGRFSTLPFYLELEQDLNNIGSQLINSWQQHSWIANFDYYHDLIDYTAESWDDYNFFRCSHDGPFVVKGKTNSRKGQWSSKMFAPNKTAAINIANELMGDSLIGSQGVIYRKYIPLVTYEIGINELPFTNEWRFFYYRGTRLSYGYYWTLASHPEKAKMNAEGLAFADEIANLAKDHANFFVLDIAEKEEGGWVLIEVNEGQQSGLSANDPDVLYSNLSQALNASSEI